MNKNEDILVAGKIIFDDTINESEVTRKKSRFNPKHIGECKVEVYGPNEGIIPRFHIVNKDGSFNCCVRIYDNHFFQHGNHRDILNTTQCKQLHEWLQQINDKSIVPMSNWSALALMWEAANGDCIYPESKKCKIQPRYDLMNCFKEGI